MSGKKREAKPLRVIPMPDGPAVNREILGHQDNGSPIDPRHAAHQSIRWNRCATAWIRRAHQRTHLRERSRVAQASDPLPSVQATFPVLPRQSLGPAHAFGTPETNFAVRQEIAPLSVHADLLDNWPLTSALAAR